MNDSRAAICDRSRKGISAPGQLQQNADILQAEGSEMTEGTGLDGRPRMIDVGRLANVSAQTVSRYFTGGYVGAQARERIEEAVEVLGYRVNSAARRLKSNKADSIGMIAMGHPNFGTWAILEGMTAASRSSGYSLVIGQLDIVVSDPSSPSELSVAVEQLLRSGVEGIIISSPFSGSEKLFPSALGTLPFVIISEHPEVSTNSAQGDSFAGGMLAMNHLLGLGHRRIVHIGGDPATIEAEHRRAAYHDAMATRGLEALPVRSKDWTGDWGYEAGSTLEVGTFSAIYAANDPIAAGVIAALRERGLHSPKDYSIVGIDDMVESRFAAPPLTSVSLHFPVLGRTAVEMLIERIQGGEVLDQRVVTPELVLRKSTRPFTLQHSTR